MKQDNLDKPLMHLFVHIGKLIEDRLRSALSKQGIHIGQARILTTLLSHETLTQREIAVGLHIKPATVTNLVKKMEVSELISRKRGESDDRIINVTLTQKGTEAALFTAKVISQIEDDIRSQFSQREVESLRSPLEGIRNTLGGLDPSI
jgi:DNA-binding MarR family transcriptional regulator